MIFCMYNFFKDFQGLFVLMIAFFLCFLFSSCLTNRYFANFYKHKRWYENYMVPLFVKEMFFFRNAQIKSNLCIWLNSWPMIFNLSYVDIDVKGLNVRDYLPLDSCIRADNFESLPVWKCLNKLLGLPSVARYR